MKILTKSSKAGLHLMMALSMFSALPSADAGKSPDSILFIGSSFTLCSGNARIVGAGGVPGLVRDFATARGLTPKIKWATNFKFTLRDHLGDESAALKFIHEQQWNAVVIQDLSTAPTNYGERQVGEYEQDVKAFAFLIRRASPEARIVLFETWARHPDHVTYKTDAFPGGPATMQRVVSENIARVAEANTAEVAPVGLAFLLAANEIPELRLHGDDMASAGPNGCYLAGLVMFAKLCDQDPRGLPTIEEVSEEDAKRLQDVAFKAVSPSTTPPAIESPY